MIPTLSRHVVVRLLFALALAIPSIARGDCLAPFWQLTQVAQLSASSLAAADLDGDGKPDVAGMTATAVFVLRNAGAGTFAAPVYVYNGAPRSSLIAADFNGDQRIDLAFAREGALIVLPGKGDGTFDAAIESAIGITPKDLAAARFDGDSALDLAAFDAAAAKLVVFRNSGTGAFTELQTSTITAEATAMTAADLDVDGRMDAVIGYLNRNSLDVFYGRGNGTLDPAVTIAAPILAVSLKAADMDANGLPDLAVARFPGGVSVIPNLGGRSFGDPLSYDLFLPMPVNDLAAADLTGDDKLDLVMSSQCGIRTSTGSGTGTLLRQWYADEPGCFPSNSLDGSLTVSDFDGDGRIDAVASIPHPFGPRMIAFRNVCGSTAMSATTTTPTISVGQSVTVAIDVRSPAPQTFTIAATGTVSVREGQQVLATVPVLVQANATIAGLAAGEHTLVADYSGDAQYEPLSKELVVRVTTATTTTTLRADPPVTVYGHPPNLTATVTSSTGDTPGGTFRITIDGQHYSDRNAPQATVSGPDTIGVHTVVAEYSGDATHPPSTAATTTYVVDRQTPKITVTPAFAVEGTPVDGVVVGFLYTGHDWPQGTLALQLGDTVIGSKSTANAPYQNFALPALAAGRHALRVTFSGDSNYKAVDTIVPFRVFPAAERTMDARGTEESVVLSWHAVEHPIIRRMRPGGAAEGEICCPPPPWLDTHPAPETVYLYQMASYAGNSFSNIDVGMRFAFTDDPTGPQTHVTSLHLEEVVRATNILRAAGSLGAVSLPPTPPSTKRRRSARSGSGIPVSHVPLLRTAINEARTKLGAYAFTFTAPIVQGAALNASQLQELREAVR